MSIWLLSAARSSKAISAKRFTLTMEVGGTVKRAARLEVQIFIGFSDRLVYGWVHYGMMITEEQFLC